MTYEKLQSNNYKTLNECKSTYVQECYDSEIKYEPAYWSVVGLLFVAPMIAGPLIALNEKLFTEWGWLPYYKETKDKYII